MADKENRLVVGEAVEYLLQLGYCLEPSDALKERYGEPTEENIARTHKGMNDALLNMIAYAPHDIDPQSIAGPFCLRPGAAPTAEAYINKSWTTAVELFRLNRTWLAGVAARGALIRSGQWPPALPLPVAYETLQERLGAERKLSVAQPLGSLPVAEAFQTPAAVSAEPAPVLHSNGF